MGVPSTVPRIEYNKILYTTDLSESGRYAFHHAASLARCHGAELVVLHVVEGGPELDRRLFGYVDEQLWEEIKTRNLAEARNILISRRRDDAAVRNAVGEYCQQLEAEQPNEASVVYCVEVEMGEPADRILEKAEAGGFDLIVMGRHGHSTLKHAIMGNTVKEVVMRSKVPVLVVQVPD